MAGKNNVQPIIKKKKIVQGDGHHGGAWKVAYADFVTAMMAFFLLMWLLSVSSEEQREGLADYFSPTIPIHSQSSGGDGPFDGSSIFAEDTQIRDGMGASAENPTSEDFARGDTGHAPDLDTDGDQESANADIRAVEALFLRLAGESLHGDEMLEHIVTRVTDEGLIIEVFDLPERPIFMDMTDAPSFILEQILSVVAEVLGLVTNGVAVDGHLSAEIRDSLAWSLSVDRAQSVRRVLMVSGVEPMRFMRVTGHAARSPVVENSLEPRNSRIVVTVLRSDISE